MEDSSEDTPETVNEENNLSDKVFEQEQRYRPRGRAPQRYGGGGGYGDRRSSDRRGPPGRGQRRRY